MTGDSTRREEIKIGLGDVNLDAFDGRARHNPDVTIEAKIMAMPELLAWREKLRAQKRRLVVTNGCFDILHIGHVAYLQAARALGDALLVGVTSDQNVGSLKGPGRPVNTELDRAFLLAALESVAAVHIFAELDARNFLTAVKPDVYAKGGDYSIDTINQDERRLLEKMGCDIKILPGVPGKSTSAILKKIASL